MRRRWPQAALGLGVLLLLLGGVMLMTRQTAPAVPPPNTALPAPVTIISPDSGGTPEATASPGWRVKVIGLGIDLPIVSGDGRTAALFKAVQEPNMKLPGQGGRTLIYAHARAGMFGPLSQATPGTKIEIDRPDGPPLRYTVKNLYRSWPATDLKLLSPADHEELVLLTCTTYDPRDPRVVAVALPD